MNKTIFRPLGPLACLALAALALGACAAPRFSYPQYEGEGYTRREPTQRERLIMRSDFSMEVVRVMDDRRARSTAMGAPDQIIYEYEPNDLLQGLNFRGPVLFNKYIATKARDPLKHYRVEVVFRDIKTQILAGDLRSGRMGRYRVCVDTDVLVRRPDSLVVVNRPYTMDLNQVRKSFNGRNPTAEMDRARTYDLFEEVVRHLAENIAWDVRMTDARRWHPYAEVARQDKAAAKAAAADAEAASSGSTGQRRLFGLLPAKQEGFSTGVEQGYVGADGKPMLGPREELVEPEQPDIAPLREEPLEPVAPENLGWGVGS